MQSCLQLMKLNFSCQSWLHGYCFSNTCSESVNTSSKTVGASTYLVTCCIKQTKKTSYESSYSHFLFQKGLLADKFLYCGCQRLVSSNKLAFCINVYKKIMISNGRFKRQVILAQESYHKQLTSCFHLTAVLIESESRTFFSFTFYSRSVLCFSTSLFCFNCLHFSIYKSFLQCCKLAINSSFFFSFNLQSKVFRSLYYSSSDLLNINGNIFNQLKVLLCPVDLNSGGKPQYIVWLVCILK